MHLSPLRYPGGKNRIANFIAQVCVDNRISGLYVEPYAGGASVALFLLFSNLVKRIIINDKDRSIYAFWYSVLHHTDKLCQMIIDTEVNVENWRKQKIVQSRKQYATLLELGFSTLFLNRTNRSGIISGGIIGGVDQTGEYKIDCRFNKVELIKRIRQIAENALQNAHDDGVLTCIIRRQFLAQFFDPCLDLLFRDQYFLNILFHNGMPLFLFTAPGWNFPK